MNKKILGWLVVGVVSALFSASVINSQAATNPWADSYGRCYDYLYAPGSTSYALPTFTLMGDVCTQDEVIAKAHVVGKALAILKDLSTSSTRLLPSPYPCASGNRGFSSLNPNGGNPSPWGVYVDISGLILGEPKQDGNWFTDESGVPNKECPLEGRIGTKASVEQAVFNVLGIAISFDDYVVDYDPFFGDVTW